MSFSYSKSSSQTAQISPPPIPVYTHVSTIVVNGNSCSDIVDGWQQAAADILATGVSISAATWSITVTGSGASQQSTITISWQANV